MASFTSRIRFAKVGSEALWSAPRRAPGAIGGRRWARSFRGEKELVSLAFIPASDRTEMIKLHFSNPDKYSAQNLAAASGAPAANIRGMLLLAHMERMLEQVMQKPYIWNIEKKVVKRIGEDGVEVEEIGFEKANETSFEMALLGRLRFFEPQALEAARIWRESLQEPNPRIDPLKKARTGRSMGSLPNFTMYDQLKGETQAKTARRVAKTLFKRFERMKQDTEVEASARKLLQKAARTRDLDRKQTRSQGKSFVFMDISVGVEPDDRKVWVFDTYLKANREANEEERERMILSQLRGDTQPDSI